MLISVEAREYRAYNISLKAKVDDVGSSMLLNFMSDQVGSVVWVRERFSHHKKKFTLCKFLCVFFFLVFIIRFGRDQKKNFKHDVFIKILFFRVIIRIM